MNINGSQAIIPKARGMFSKHLSDAEYEELLRKRTVQEIAATIKNHPYFKDSLTTLSVADPHRGQIEELLNMDIYHKYQKLARYCQPDSHFCFYYLRECEMRELLKALHLISIGYPGGYINQMSPFLEGKLSFDLFRLADARTLAQVAQAARTSIYGKALKACLAKDPALRSFPEVEAALLREYYHFVFTQIRASFSGRELEAVEGLFLREVENYNLGLIGRIKSYFPGAYSPEDIRGLLLPYTHKVNRHKLDMLMNTKSFGALVGLSRQLGIDRFIGPVDIDELDAAGDKALYRQAGRLLHMTTSPSAALAAFITLARLEKNNMISVVEGVRYKMAPERIRQLLRHTA